MKADGPVGEVSELEEGFDHFERETHGREERVSESAAGPGPASSTAPQAQAVANPEQSPQPSKELVGYLMWRVSQWLKPIQGPGSRGSNVWAPKAPLAL